MADDHGVCGPTEEASVAIDETDRLIASDKVAGTQVYGREGQRLGTIYNFMVDKITGRVAYAVISFGGFLVQRPIQNEDLPGPILKGSVAAPVDESGGLHHVKIRDAAH